MVFHMLALRFLQEVSLMTDAINQENYTEIEDTWRCQLMTRLTSYFSVKVTQLTQNYSHIMQRSFTRVNNSLQLFQIIHKTHKQHTNYIDIV